VSEIIVGRVAKIASKTGQGRRGPWTAYSGKIVLDNGAEYPNWVSFGFDRPSFSEGAYGEFTLVDDGQYKKLENFKAITKPVDHASASAPRAGNFAGSRDQSIHYQSARKDALELLKLLLEKDALPLSKAANKSGVTSRYNQLLALTDKLTVQFYNDTQTMRILETVADGRENEADEEEDRYPAPGTSDDDGDED